MGAISSIRNLRMHHDVVTRDCLNMANPSEELINTDKSVIHDDFQQLENMFQKCNTNKYTYKHTCTHTHITL
jgi:hypothetical protein